jgi:uncharacterized membrane protein
MSVLDEMASSMSIAFRKGCFTDGLVAAVRSAGVLLAAHFPPIGGAPEPDEISNEISRG